MVLARSRGVDRIVMIIKYFVTLHGLVSFPLLEHKSSRTVCAECLIVIKFENILVFDAWYKMIPIAEGLDTRMMLIKTLHSLVDIFFTLQLHFYTTKVQYTTRC